DVQSREQRRRRRLLLVSAGLLVAALSCGIVGTTIGLVVAQIKRGDAEQAKKDAEDAQRETEKARGEEARQRDAAERKGEQARRRYQLALDAFGDMVHGIQKKLETSPGTLALRKDLLEKARAGLRKLIDEAERHGEPDSTLVWAHLRMGDVE